MKAIVLENDTLPKLVGEVVTCLGAVSRHPSWIWIESDTSGVWTIPQSCVRLIDNKEAAKAIEGNTLYVGRLPANSDGRVYGPVSGDTRTLLETGIWRWYTNNDERGNE